MFHGQPSAQWALNLLLSFLGILISTLFLTLYYVITCLSFSIVGNTSPTEKVGLLASAFDQHFILSLSSPSPSESGRCNFSSSSSTTDGPLISTPFSWLPLAFWFLFFYSTTLCTKSSNKSSSPSNTSLSLSMKYSSSSSELPSFSHWPTTPFFKSV